VIVKVFIGLFLFIFNDLKLLSMLELMALIIHSATT